MNHSSYILLASLTFLIGCSHGEGTRDGDSPTPVQTPAEKSSSPELVNRVDSYNPPAETAVIGKDKGLEVELPDTAWRVFEDTAGTFRAELPGDPEVNVLNVRMPFGPLKMTTWGLDRDEIAYFIMTSRYPLEFIQEQGPDGTVFLGKALDAGMATKKGAELANRSKFEFDEGDALQQLFKFPAGVSATGKEYPAGFSFQRVFLRANGELYLIQMDVSQAYYDAHRKQVDEDRKRFFDSFVMDDR